MIKSLIRLIILVVIGVLVYNYFMGTPEEKANARAIFQEVKDVGSSIADLIRSEKDKFEAGKYDAALDRIGNMFDQIRSSDELKGDYDSELTELEQERNRLEDRLSQIDTTEENSPEAEQLQGELDSFLERTRRMIDMIQQ